MIIDLDKVKDFLRVDHDDEDHLIEEMILSASTYTLAYLNWDDSEVEERAEDLPPPVISAILLMIGDLYENRTAQAPVQLYNNRTYNRLLSPYRALAI